MFNGDTVGCDGDISMRELFSVTRFCTYSITVHLHLTVGFCKMNQFVSTTAPRSGASVLVNSKHECALDIPPVAIPMMIIMGLMTFWNEESALCDAYCKYVPLVLMSAALFLFVWTVNNHQCGHILLSWLIIKSIGFLCCFCSLVRRCV